MQFGFEIFKGAVSGTAVWRQGRGSQGRGGAGVVGFGVSSMGQRFRPLFPRRQ